MLIKESFNIKNGNFKKKDGTITKIAYIDPTTSTNTYPYKDIIKNQFNGFWLSNLKTWGWFLGQNPEKVYRDKIKPCLEWLDSQINDKRNIIELIDKLISEVSNGNIDNSIVDANSIKEKLKQFKQDLINAVSSEEFKRLILPVINFKRAQGHRFSFGNSILIILQDPKATLVKSKRNWLKFNREVNDNAPAIWLWIPTNFQPLSKQEKDTIINRYLVKNKVKTIKDLHPGEQERLQVELTGTHPKSWELGPYFYDIRFTTQIPDTEDMVGSNKINIEWFDDKGDETNEIKQYYNALLSLIQDKNIKIDYIDDLDGARGVSMSGKIGLLKNQKINIGQLNTLIHEFAHEILHQKYLKNANDEFSAYFVGTDEGRGKVEQQAELCAWIVLKMFGYDMKTNINYVGIWGLDENNAADVFDSVAKVAEIIYDGINSRLNVIKENIKLKESITGRDVAQMIGMVDLYDKSKKQSNIKNIVESITKKILYEKHGRRNDFN